MFRHRVGAGVLHLSDSVRRRQQRVRVQMSVAGLSVGRRRKCVNLVVRPLRAVLLAKRAARDKEGRAPMVNLAAHHGVERLLQPSIARRSQRAETRSRKKEHHHQGHNNSGSICHSGSGKKNSGAAFFYKLDKCNYGYGYLFGANGATSLAGWGSAPATYSQKDQR